jgi:hypothetical protein
MKQLLVLMFLSNSAMATNYSGEWKLDSVIMGIGMSAICTLKQAQNAISGFCKTDSGDLAPLLGQIDGKTVVIKYHFSYNGSSLTLQYKGMLESSTWMKGSVEIINVAVGTFVGFKNPPTHSQ